MSRFNFGFNYGGINESQNPALPAVGLDTQSRVGINADPLSSNSLNFGSNYGSNGVDANAFGAAPNAPQDLTRSLSGLEKFSVGAQGVNSLLSGFLGLKQYGLANKQYKASRDMAERNYRNQVSSYNENLADRQRGRGQSDEEIASYMSQYGLGR